MFFILEGEGEGEGEGELRFGDWRYPRCGPRATTLGGSM